MGIWPPSTWLSFYPEKSNVVQRVLNVLGFLWVLCQATVDGLTQWLRAFTKEHEQLSAVLGLERFVLTQQLDQVGLAWYSWAWEGRLLEGGRKGVRYDPLGDGM